MVTWLTPEYGKVVTSVKGACRPKSAFLGQYDLFYTCDLLFYRHDRDGIHAIRECTPLSMRETLRSAWRPAAAAAYLADLTARVTPVQQEAGAQFELLTHTLDRLADMRSVDALRTLTLWYEVRLLGLLGLSPDLTLCPICHTPDRKWFRFSLASGRFICPHLTHPQAGEATVSVHCQVRELLLSLMHWNGLPDAINHEINIFASNKNTPKTNLLLGLSRFLGMFISFHLDVPSAVRRVTWEMLDITHTHTNASLERNQP